MLFQTVNDFNDVTYILIIAGVLLGIFCIVLYVISINLINYKLRRNDKKNMEVRSEAVKKEEE